MPRPIKQDLDELDILDNSLEDISDLLYKTSEIGAGARADLILAESTPRSGMKIIKK